MEKTINHIQKNIKLFVGFLSISVFALAPTALQAANVYLSPSSGTYNQDATFSAAVFITSPEQAANAVSATIKFPKDTLQVISVSKSSSVVDFWAQEPVFSNSTGEIRFEGVILTPGYQGGAGKIITINFKGKQSGVGAVTIPFSTVLANDGLGTNISKAASGATFTIREVPKEQEIIKVDELKPVEESEILEVCEPDSIITSSTHPGVVWRRENTAAFSWDLPEGTLASKIAFDKNPTTEPTTIHSPAIVEKRYENLTDGIWYFHLSLQDNNGWSKTEHFKIKIDHTPPTIEAREIKRSDLTDPHPIITVSVTDTISCVKNIELSINGEALEYEKLTTGDLKLQALEPGEHELVITAYDRAGNKNETFLPLVVEALPVPEVTDYPAEISSNETLRIKGETIQNGNVEAKVTSKKNNFLIRQEFQSGSGRFTFEQASLKKGVVFVSFRVSDARGAYSQWSKPVEVKVVGETPFGLDGLLGAVGPEILILGGVFLIFIIVLVTRALTIRRLRRTLGVE